MRAWPAPRSPHRTIQIDGVDPRPFAGEAARNRWDGGPSFPSKVASHPTFPRDQKFRSETQNCASDGENGAEAPLLDSDGAEPDRQSEEEEGAQSAEHQNSDDRASSEAVSEKAIAWTRSVATDFLSDGGPPPRDELIEAGWAKGLRTNAPSKLRHSSAVCELSPHPIVPTVTVTHHHFHFAGQCLCGKDPCLRRSFSPATIATETAAFPDASLRRCQRIR